MKIEIHQGTLPECLDDWPENHFAAVFGDDPYGLHDLSSAQVTRLMVAWLAGEDGVQADGMLGRKWDVVPPPRLNAEILRVMKPGALRLAYNGKSADLAGMSLRLAGFKMLPSFVRIHGGAMALGQSTGKAIDKAKGLEREVIGKRRKIDAFGPSNMTAGSGPDHGGIQDITAPASPLATAFDGHASQVKNSHEPILCARKPLDGTGAEVAECHGVGGFNVQAGLIPSGESTTRPSGKNGAVYGAEGGGAMRGSEAGTGRYPSTVLFSHLEDCGATRCADGCPVAVVGDEGWLTRGDNYHMIEPWQNETRGERSTRDSADGCGRGATQEAARYTGPPTQGGSGSKSSETSGKGGSSTTSTTITRTTDSTILPPGPRRSITGTTQGVGKITRESTGSNTDGAKNARPTDPSNASPVELTVHTKEHVALAQRSGSDGGATRIGPSTTSTCGTTTGERAPQQDPLKSRVRFYYQGRASRRERHAGAEHLLWVRDVDHADGWRLVDEAEFNLADESERCAGNPGLAVKAVDGGVYLAKLLLQPTIDGVEPVLLVPFCGSGSEIIAAMLAGWTRIVAYEMSRQMCELARARVSWWQERVEAGHRGDALDMLRGWGTAPDVEPVNDGQMSVFDV